MKNINMIAIVLLIAGLGSGFFAGMKYEQSSFSKQQNQVSNLGQGQLNRTRGNPPRNFGQGNQLGRGAVVGQIINQDDKSITVKLQDNSSKIVLLSGSTTISKTDTGSKTDLKTGTNVAVIGTTNSDGSVTAQNVQLNPMFRDRLGSPSASPR